MQKPLAITFGTRQSDQAVFITRQGECTIEDYIEEIFSILPLCNGLRTIEEIADLTEISLDDLTDLLTQLEQLQIVADSSHLYTLFLEDMSYGSQYKNSINPADISSLKSPIALERIDSSHKNKDKLLNTLQTRRTTRVFKESEKSIYPTLQILFENMYFINGRSTVPSAGGLYPLVFYIYMLNDADNHKRGLYEYDPIGKSLKRTPSQLNIEELRYIFGEKDIFKNAACIVFIGANTLKHPTKYGNRGLTYTLLETGHAAQNIQLLSNALGLGVLEVGGFNAEFMHRACNFTDDFRILLPLIIGTPADDNTDLSYELSLQATEKLWSLMERYVGANKAIEWIDSEALSYKEHTMPRVSSIASFAAVEKKPIGREMKGFSFATGYSTIESATKTIAEAIERLASGNHTIGFTGSLHEIKAKHKEYLDPDTVWPIDKRWYERPNIRKRYEAFSPTKQYGWTAGVNLSTQVETYVIEDQVYYPLHQEKIGRSLICNVSSSGVAAHFLRLEAQQRALLELIERDALAIMWFGNRNPSLIPLEYLPDDLRDRTRYWTKDNRNKLSFFDITVEGVPTAMACMRRESYPYFVVGAAASFTMEPALMKAFDELEATLMSWLKEHNAAVATDDIESPHNHGIYYANLRDQRDMEWLFESTKATRSVSYPKVDYTDLLKKYSPVEVVLQQAASEQDLWVVRVLSDKLMPLNFGYGNEATLHKRLKGLKLNRRWSTYPAPPHFFP